MDRELREGYETWIAVYSIHFPDGYYGHHVSNRLKKMKLELSFLKMFFQGLAYLEGFENDWHMLFTNNCLEHEFSKLRKEFESFQDEKLEDVISVNEGAIQKLKPIVKDSCLYLSGGGFTCTSCPSNQNAFLEYARETASFISLVQQNLGTLLESELISPGMKRQIVLITAKLEKFVEPSRLLITKVKKLYGLVSHARMWCSRVTCLTYLYLVEGKDEHLAASMESIFVGLLHKTVPFNTSGVISSNCPRTMIPQLLGAHFDVLLENLVIPIKADLQEGLIFLLSFITDPPEDDSEKREMICTQIYSIINEFPFLMHSWEKKGGMHCVDFSDFILKVEGVKSKVKELYVVTPYSCQLRAPFTNLIGFLKTVIRNLQEMRKDLLPSLIYQEKLLQKELVLLIPVVTNMKGMLQDERVYKGIRDLWTSVINKVYNAFYFSKLCYPRAFYLWYGMVGLPVVIDDIKSIKVEMDKLVGFKKRTKKVPPHKETITLLQRGTTSKIERNFTGFIEVEKMIIDELINDQKPLAIISITGSGGQGKTTLAKRIYNDSKVQYHFHKSIWCYVSKDCPVKEILTQLLSCDAINDGVHDLADRVRKSLKGRKYLIVMDDIWDSDGWRKLESSFPDDKNGSRILFTCRNHELASQVKSNSISHSLQLFSNEESWELMRKEVFDLGSCDEELAGIGKRIASYCKGLPLAVVLIAGVLKRTGQHLDTWIKVADNLKAHLAKEGCENVIELSYKYLPDHLKSCFQYFAVFPRGENVGAKKLKLLWIGEGFIVQDPEAKFSKMDLASEYLDELASQSLVMVSERSTSPTSGIKVCSVHDLLYDLCLERCKEDTFLIWKEECSNDNKVRKYSHHRLRIGVSDPFIKSIPIVSKRELPISPLYSFLWFGDKYQGRNFSARFLESFKLLTVLNLEVEVFIDRFPEEIYSLIYLGYLKLKFSGTLGIKVVPLNIHDLHMLETIIIYGGTWKLPEYFLNMKCLWHVRFELDCSGIFFRGESNIERLGKVNLFSVDGKTTEFLQSFPQLTKLSVNTRHMLKLLGMIGSLSTKLKSLTVNSWGFHAPTPTICNFTKIENLNKLSLRFTCIPWSVLSEIGKKLPNLYVLKLLESSCVGCNWKLEDGDFSKLMYLKIYRLDIEEIDVSGCEEIPFPRLEHLVLLECTKLGEIPSVFEEIDTWKTIKVSHCHKKVRDSAMWILEQQKDFGNDNFQVKIENTLQ